MHARARRLLLKQFLTEAGLANLQSMFQERRELFLVGGFRVIKLRMAAELKLMAPPVHIYIPEKMQIDAQQLKHWTLLVVNRRAAMSMLRHQLRGEDTIIGSMKSKQVLNIAEESGGNEAKTRKGSYLLPWI